MSISIKNVSYVYDDGSINKIYALKAISTTISKHCMTAIIGKTGCGKTTLMQHLNALLRPTSGEIVIDEFVISNQSKHKTLKPLRAKVGLVFQFSENQLFEDTVKKDIAFGPKNFKMADEVIEKKVLEVIQMVGLDASYLERSCLHLSGGEKRRVAIAGILAIDPEIIILDEPTAGLDPQGAFEMMQLFKKIQKKYHKTIIVVTHDNDLVYEYFDEVLLLDEGKLIAKETVVDFFEKYHDVEIPRILQLKQLFSEKGITISKNAKTIEAVLKEVKNECIG